MKITKLNLEGKVAVITGGGGVLCSTMAKGLAERGVKTAILDLNEEAANKVAKEISETYNIKSIGVAASVLSKESLTDALNVIKKELGEIDYVPASMKDFAESCGYHGKPYKWDEERRFQLQCELDALFFHLYGIKRDDVEYIMETFPIVKRKDESQLGSYITREKIQIAFDNMEIIT